jgi:hypothetical protein
MIFLVLILTALLASTTAANAGFIVAAVVAAVGITGVAATVATFVGTVALSVGVSWLASKLMPKPEQAASNLGVELNIRVDPETPQSLLLGRCVTAGSLVYAETYGKRNEIDNSDLVEVIAIADHPCEGLVDVYVDEVQRNLVPAGAGNPGQFWGPLAQQRGDLVDGFSGYLAVKFYDGTQVAADPFAVAACGAQPGRPYTSAMLGMGITYARTHSIYNTDKVPGAMHWRFVIDGALLYDPRKDTTVGGSGSHRWDDLATHEFSSNLAVQAYNILRGIRVKDQNGLNQHFYGIENTPAENLPLSNWFAAMNECDVLVDGEPQFHGGIEVPVNMEPLEVVRQILSACDGRLSEIGGIYKCYVGVPGVPVATFTDEILRADEGDQLRPITPLERRVNHVAGSYTSPADGWVPKVAPARSVATWEEEDGRRLPGYLDAPMVQSGAHMQRLMKQMLLRSRQQRRHSIPLPPSLFGLEPGDVVEWTSEVNGYVEKLFEVDAVEENEDLSSVVALIELDPDDYDWDGETDLIPETVVSLVVDRPAPKIIEGFDVQAISHDGTNGVSRPAIRVTWDPPEDGDLKTVEVQIRRPTQPTEIATFPTDEPASGEMIILASITPNTEYEVRGRFISFEGLETEWSLWISITSLDIRIIRDELNDELDARLRRLEEIPIRDIANVQDQIDRIATALNSQISYITERVGRITLGVGSKTGQALAGVEIAMEAVTDTNQALAALDSTVIAQFGDAFTQIESALTAIADIDEALGTLEETVTAAVNDSLAEGKIRFLASAGVGGALASIRIEVRATTGDAFSFAGIRLDVFA